jgi:hypothetical protein
MTVTPWAYVVGVSEWRPWRALRERSTIEFMLCDLPPGVRAIYGRRGDDEAIIVNQTLTPAERLAAIAHELVHVERGGSGHCAGAPQSWGAVVAREEARVDRIVAERLVPLGRLADFVTARAELEGVTAEHAAEEFGVPADVAERAMRALIDRRSA